MNDEPMIKLVHPRLTEGRSEPLRMNRSAKQSTWQAGGVLMLLGLMAICGGVPVRAQTEEKAVNLVDTAAVLARLNGRSAHGLALEDHRRERFTEGNLSPRRMEPARDGTAADGASPDEAVPNSAQSAASNGPRFQITPYLWMSGIKGSVGAGARVADVDVSFSEIFDEVNFGFATTFEAQWGGKWRFVADLNYINLSDDKGTPGPLFDGAQVTAKTFIFDPEIGYSIAGNDAASLDVMAGIRYWHLENDLELRRGPDRLRVSGTANWVDLVGGMRVKAALSRALYVTAKADVGGIGSDLTYQLFGGIGLNLSPRFTTIIGYRYLDVNYRGGNTIFDVAMGGLIMGFGIRF